MSRSRFWLTFVAPAAVVFGLLSICPAAFAQTSRGPYKDVREMPAGEAGKRITELLRVINANDPEKVRALVTDAFAPKFKDFAPMENHLGIFAEVFTQSGGLEFYGIRQYEGGGNPGETVVILRAKLTDAWQAFVLTVDPQPPHQITSLNFAPARPPSDLPAAKKLTDADMVAELKKLVQKLADAEVFSGSVLLAKDGKVLFSGAYGLASREFNVPNKLDTKFNLGSMNKMFTAVAVAQLVQAGKLAFDDPISKHLSEDWLPRAVTDKIKIAHLLSHTSGLGSYFSEKFMNSSRELFRVIDDYKPVVAEETLQFEPGTNWAYSNTGFLLLGVIIEKVTGQTYFDYIRENVYKPAGMINSDSYEMDRMPPNLALGYSKRPSGQSTVWVNNLYRHTIKGGPAGGGFSTVEDLLRFDQAMRSHKLLSKDLSEQLWTPKPSSPQYGYGFGLTVTPGHRTVGHSGGFDGISSDLDIYLDQGYTVAVMSNHDNGSRAIASKLREWIKAD